MHAAQFDWQGRIERSEFALDPIGHHLRIHQRPNRYFAVPPTVWRLLIPEHLGRRALAQDVILRIGCSPWPQVSYIRRNSHYRVPRFRLDALANGISFWKQPARKGFAQHHGALGWRAIPLLKTATANNR